MVGETLHAFDLELCDDVMMNVFTNFDDPKFLALVQENLQAPVFAHLVALRGSGFPQDPLPDGGTTDPPRLLLTEQEFEDLEEACTGSDDPEVDWVPDRIWTRSTYMYRRYINCVPEIREQLTPTIADTWVKKSIAFAKTLRSKRLKLQDGIKEIRKWTNELRRLLAAMKATRLLPAPEGSYPTPTSFTSTSICEPIADHEAVEIMRNAIAKHDRLNSARPANERGKYAKAGELVKLARIRPKPGRDALRWLEIRGDYHGFARGRPTRYRKIL